MSPAGAKLGAAALCVLAWAGLAAGDRVYIHPFHLLAYSKSSCERLEAPTAEPARPPSLAPAPIQAGAPAVDEAELRQQLALAARQPEDGDRARVAAVGMLLGFLGARLQKARGAPGGAVLSPTAAFGTLASFYLGASGPTAGRLQAFLGVPGEGRSCTSRLDGRKVLAALQTAQGLLVARGGARLLLSTVLGIFTAPGLRLKRPFVQGLAHFAPVTLPRALDLATDPGLAAEKINRFMEAATGWGLGSPVTRVSPDSTLLFDAYIHFQAQMKGFALLAGRRDFWVDNATSVPVPMLSSTGTFQHWSDAHGNLSVTRVPLSDNVHLLLVQPHHASDLPRAEALAFQYDLLSWTKNLSPRTMRLTMPQLVLRDSYDLQDLLAQAKVPTLLGTEATLGGISDGKLRVGQVLNSILFELKPDAEEPPMDSARQAAGPETLDVTLDSPFLFAVYEQDSTAVHFVGRVTDPRSGA